MTEHLRAYPLTWPDSWQRTPPGRRKRGHFNKKTTTQGETHRWVRTVELSIFDAVERVLTQLAAMQIKRDDTIISTNVPTRFDGMPRSDQRKPEDPGCAVYWRPTSKPGAITRCIAIDIYTTVQDNLAAIAATLEAMRAIERHGGAQVQERTFRGFAALPAQTGLFWWDVLQVRQDSPRDVIEASFRRLLRDRHPDAGGSHDAMAELNRARQEALAQLAN